MNKLIILVLFIFPEFSKAQSDLLVLKKRGMHVATYTIGSELTMQTIYNQWFLGTITDMRNDSVFVNGIPFHYKEIAGIRESHINFSNTVLSAGMMVAGGGIFVLGAVNGLYRGDKTKDWYTSSGLITGGILLAGGFLLSKTRSKTYHIGKKFQVEYLVLQPGNHSL